MEAAAVPKSSWTFAQWGIVVLAAIQLTWALAGFIAEPSIDFARDGLACLLRVPLDVVAMHAAQEFRFTKNAAAMAG